MAHRFEIRKNKAGEFVAYFCYNSETIFWTEGYSSKASAKNAIESIKKNGPDAEVVDRALTMANEIAQNGRLAVRGAKRAMNALSRPGHENAIAFESSVQAVLFDSDDKKARMDAFLQKQKKS